MPRSFSRIAIAAVLLALPAIAGAQDNAQDNEYADRLKALGEAQIRAAAQNPLVIAAIEAQNKVTASYDAAKIE